MDSLRELTSTNGLSASNSQNWTHNPLKPCTPSLCSINGLKQKTDLTKEKVDGARMEEMKYFEGMGVDQMAYEQAIEWLGRDPIGITWVDVRRPDKRLRYTRGDAANGSSEKWWQQGWLRESGNEGTRRHCFAVACSCRR